MTRATDLKDLRLELRKASRRQLQLFTRPNQTDEIEYPLLAQIVERLRPIDWHANRTSALGAVMESAIRKLSDKEQVSGFSLTWFDFGDILFSRRKLPGIKKGGRKNYTYKNICDFVKEEYCSAVSDETFTDRTTKLRLQLAIILLDMEKQAVNQRSDVSEPAAAYEGIAFETNYVDGYIPRVELHNQFSDLISAGSKSLIFHGAPGSGKTRLVRHLVHESDMQGSYLWIDASTEARFADSIFSALESGGHSVISSETAVLVRLLRQHLVSDQAPRFVVFDHVTDFRRMEACLGTRMKSIALFTTRNVHSHGISGADLVRVSGMYDSEAVRFFYTLTTEDPTSIPGFGLKESPNRQRRQEEFGSYILSVAHTVGSMPAYMKEVFSYTVRPTGVTLYDLGRQLWENPLLFLSTESADNSPIEFAKENLRKLRSYPNAFALLEVMLVGGNGELSEVAPLLCAHLGVKDMSEALQQEITRRAFEVLEAHHIFDYEPDAFGRNALTPGNLMRQAFLNCLPRSQLISAAATLRDTMLAAYHAEIDHLSVSRNYIDDFSVYIKRKSRNYLRSFENVLAFIAEMNGDFMLVTLSSLSRWIEARYNITAQEQRKKYFPGMSLPRPFLVVSPKRSEILFHRANYAAAPDKWMSKQLSMLRYPFDFEQNILLPSESAYEIDSRNSS